MKASKEQLAELRAKHKRAFHVDHEDLGTFVFRKPNRSEWALFQRTVSDDRVAAQERLAKECLVFPELRPGEPDVEKFDDYLEEEPAAMQGSIFPKLFDIAGGTAEAKNV